jgi:hypothetical protein
MLSEDHLYSLLMRSTPARMEQAASKEQGIFFNDKKAKKELFNLLHFCFKLYWFVIVFFPEYNWLTKEGGPGSINVRSKLNTHQPEHTRKC